VEFQLVVPKDIAKAERELIATARERMRLRQGADGRGLPDVRVAVGKVTVCLSPDR